MKKYYFKFISVIILFNIIMLNNKLKYKKVSEIFHEYAINAKKYKTKDIDQYEMSDKIIIEKRVKEILIKIENIALFCPFKAKCIHKSFIAFRILRKDLNLPIKLVVGISNFPFQAHSWIKHGEDNIVDDYLETDKYTIILDSDEVGD